MTMTIHLFVTRNYPLDWQVLNTWQNNSMHNTERLLHVETTSPFKISRDTLGVNFVCGATGHISLLPK